MSIKSIKKNTDNFIFDCFLFAIKKAGANSRNGRDSNPKYLGLKKNHGQPVKSGQIIYTQRGLKWKPGKNVKSAKNHTIFALKDGIVNYKIVKNLKYISVII